MKRKNKIKTSENLADSYALKFISSYTRYEIDGRVHRALVNLFLAFEKDIRNDIASKIKIETVA